MKSRYQILLDQYNNRGRPEPITQKNALSMIFGAIFIIYYIIMLLHGQIVGLIINYIFVGVISAIAVWAQLKYFNNVSPAIIQRLFKNNSFFKIIIAWLPAIYLDKVAKWTYN